MFKLKNRILFNLACAALPATRFFKLKNFVAKISNISVGSNTKIAGGVRVYGRGSVTIGNDCWIGLGVVMYTSSDSLLCIGDRCDIAPQVIFHNGSHIVGGRERRAGVGFSDCIVIGNATWIGVGSIVTAGALVGEACIIGAGSVLRKGSYGNDKLIAGVPAECKKSL